MITVLASASALQQYQPLIMLGLIIVIMWFFIFRPQQKKQKEIQNFRNSIKEGQEVVTAGGIYGVVKKIQEAGGVDFTMPILLGYTGLDDRLMQQYIQDSRELWQDGTERLDSVCIGSVIGTYAGPGAVVAAFFRKGGK